MVSLKVELREEGVEARCSGMGYLGRRTTIEFDEIATLEDLEQALLAIAVAAGFSYVGDITAHKLRSTALAGEDSRSLAGEDDE